MQLSISVSVLTLKLQVLRHKHFARKNNVSSLVFIAANKICCKFMSTFSVKLLRYGIKLVKYLQRHLS